MSSRSGLRLFAQPTRIYHVSSSDTLVAGSA